MQRALHSGNRSPQKPRAQVGASDLLSLHTTLPRALCRGTDGQLRMPSKGSGRGSGKRKSFQCTCALWQTGTTPPPPTPPNTFYINSTQKTHSRYCITPLYLCYQLQERLNFPSFSPPPRTVIKYLLQMSLFLGEAGWSLPAVAGQTVNSEKKSLSLNARWASLQHPTARKVKAEKKTENPVLPSSWPKKFPVKLQGGAGRAQTSPLF